MALEVMKILLQIALLVVLLVGRNVDGQTLERCETGSCMTPRTCESGYYHQKQWMTEPFQDCCYNEVVGYRSTYTAPYETLLQLDCRYRNVDRLAQTEANQSVRLLDLSFNKLQRKGRHLRDNFLQYFTQIRSLRISTSQLDKVASNFLSQNRDLEHLVMSYNILRHLPEGLLANCPDLVKVDFSWNHISALPKDLFKHNPRIQEIKLDRNRLKYLSSEVFKHTPALESLDVSYNRALNCISTSFLRHTPRITYVGLKDIGITFMRQLRQEFCNDGACSAEIRDLQRLLTLYRPFKYFRARSRRVKDACPEDGGRE